MNLFGKPKISRFTFYVNLKALTINTIKRIAHLGCSKNFHVKKWLNKILKSDTEFEDRNDIVFLSEITNVKNFSILNVKPIKTDHRELFFSRSNQLFRIRSARNWDSNTSLRIFRVICTWVKTFRPAI